MFTATRGGIVMQLVETKKFLDAIKNRRSFLIYDTETTGLDAAMNVIVEYSAFIMEFKDGKYQKTDSIEQYIRPKYLMTPEVIKIHGITNEFLADKPFEEEAWINIRAFLDKHNDAIVVGYNNVWFDDKFIYNLALRNGEDWDEHPIEEIDVFLMVKENIFQKDRKLATMHHLLCVDEAKKLEEEGKYHNSTADIKATWDVAVALYNMQRIPKVKVHLANYSFVDYGKGRKYLFVSVQRTDTNEFIKLQYDHYKHMWSSKEADLTGLDIAGLEEELNQYATGGFTKITGKFTKIWQKA